MIAATTACNRPHPTSLGRATSLVEGGATGRATLCQGRERRRLSVALIWDSPSIVAGEEGRSSPVPNDRRGRRPHRRATPARDTAAVCDGITDHWDGAPGKSVSDSESDSSNDGACFPPCRLLLTGRARRSAPRIRGGEAASQGPFARPEESLIPHDLRPRALPRKMLRSAGRPRTDGRKRDRRPRPETNLLRRPSPTAEVESCSRGFSDGWASPMR